MEIIHLTICINEYPVLNYYLNSQNLEIIPFFLAEKLPSKPIIANYNLKITKGPCLRKITTQTYTYYEINFEQAYKELYLIPKNEYTKLERYLTKLIKLVLQDNPNELLAFLSKTKIFNKTSLLEIKGIFKQSKNKHYFLKDKNSTLC